MLEIGDMTALRGELDAFLAHFDDCFKSTPTRRHLRTYIGGQVSSLDRKSVEPIALAAGVPPRTLQEFLSLHLWDHDHVLSRLRALVMRDHGDGHAVAVVDATGFPKKGGDTVGVQRQYCGQTGKIDNCVVTVHLSRVAGDFRCLVDGDLYLPEAWAEDRRRRAKAEIPDHVKHRPKWRIALDLLERSLKDGMTFTSLTADEEFGRVGPFREGVEKLGLTYVVEVPCHTSVWEMDAHDRRADAIRADELLKPSRRWQAYHIKDTGKGPVVWRAKALRVRVRGEGLKAGKECWLIVASNTTDEETKFFLSNAPSDTSVAAMLRVAFSRWSIERCFQDAKGEVGMGQFEARRYKAVMRHLSLSMVSLYFLMDQSHRLGKKKSALEPVPGKADHRSAA